MNERPRAVNKRLTGSGPAPSIGFLIDWLEDGRYHWPILRGAMDAAYDRGANLVCFVGGAGAGADLARGENWLFEIARPQNVDALIVLAGSLGNVMGSKGLAAYLARFRPIPICSVALPLDGTSSVGIDNAEGMRNAVEHLVKVHGQQRIAFIRGPAASDEAELRLRAYRDVLEQNGIPYASELVVPGDFNSPAGRQAVATLFDERKLPLSAFGAIVAANDLMALSALEELRRRNIRVPEQVAVVGFDNIDESRFALPPLTTVGQPLHEQGREAVRIVLEQLRDGSVPERAMRRTELVIRRSCGCLQGSSWNRKSSAPPAPGVNLSFDAALIRRRQHILADLARAAQGELGAAGPQWDSRLLGAAAEQIRGDSPDAFTRTYDDLLRRLLTAGADPAVCNDVISALRVRLVRCATDAKQRMAAENLFHEARLMTTHAVERIHVAKEMRVWSDARALMQTGAALMGARSFEELGRLVHEQMPKAGIPRTFVIRLFEGAGGTMGQVVVAEKPDARKSDPTRSATYPVTDILRQTVLPGTDEHAFAVFPVQIGETTRGLVILEIAGASDGHAFETLRQIFAAVLSRMPT